MKYARIVDNVVVALSTEQFADYTVQVADDIDVGMSPTADAQAIAAAIVARDRAARISAAKQREAAILSAGLEYPPGSGVFHALTQSDRGKYNDIKIRKDKLPNAAILVEGLGHKTVRVTPAQIEAFDDLATTHVLAVNQACLAEIDALWRATTKAEIDAIPMSNP